MISKAVEEIFELIDLTSGNVIDDFADVNDALAAIHRVAGKHGWSSVENLSLMRVQGDCQSVIAMQETLVSLARSFEQEHLDAIPRAS